MFLLLSIQIQVLLDEKSEEISLTFESLRGKADKSPFHRTARALDVEASKFLVSYKSQPAIQTFGQRRNQGLFCVFHPTKDHGMWIQEKEKSKILQSNSNQYLYE